MTEPRPVCWAACYVFSKLMDRPGMVEGAVAVRSSFREVLFTRLGWDGTRG